MNRSKWVYSINPTMINGVKGVEKKRMKNNKRPGFGFIGVHNGSSNHCYHDRPLILRR